MSTTGKIDWNKVVADSNGASLFLPEKFFEQAQENEKAQKVLEKIALEMSEKEAILNNSHQNLLFNMQHWMSENGYKNIWVKNIGFNVDALKDGKFVINVVEPMKNQSYRQ